MGKGEKTCHPLNWISFHFLFLFSTKFLTQGTRSRLVKGGVFSELSCHSQSLVGSTLDTILAAVLVPFFLLLVTDQGR